MARPDDTTTASVRAVLERLARGDVSVDEAAERLARDHVADLGHTAVDLHRDLRRGLPEAVYGQGKRPDQIRAIVDRLVEAGQTAIVTRIGPEVGEPLVAGRADAEYHPLARIAVARPGPAPPGDPGIVVFCAGTTDLSVAEEAAVTAEAFGHRVERIRDVGVAGLHRLLGHADAIARARVAVVVAGMEGALPSVLAGLVSCPVIGVPTSTGYGPGGDGSTALSAMLHSCAAGVTVVNVDNGFGAGYAAALIRRSQRRTETSAS